MKWRPEVPRFIRSRTTGRSRIKKITPEGPKQLYSSGRRVALHLAIQDAVIEMSARPGGGVSYVVEEIAGGFEFSRISLRLDSLTPSSPTVWLAAVGDQDVTLAVVVKTEEDLEEWTFLADIVGGTIVPLRAFFDSAGITMSSGRSVDLRVLRGSGPIRVFRMVPQIRRVLN